MTQRTAGAPGEPGDIPTLGEAGSGDTFSTGATYPGGTFSTGPTRVGPPPVSSGGGKPLGPGAFDAPNPSSVDESQARALMTRFQGLMSQKRGLHVPQHPKMLGKGTRGVAFSIGGGRALKVTADHGEAVAANKIRTSNLGHVVRVYDVFRFKDTQVFAVVQEELQPLSGTEKEELNGALVATGLPIWLKQAHGEWEGAKRLVRDWLRKKAAKLDRGDAKELLDGANRAWNVLRTKYHVDEVARELLSVGIQFQDYHAGNFMKRGSEYVLIDVGYSKVEGGKEPDILERAQLAVEDTAAPEARMDDLEFNRTLVLAREKLAKRGITFAAAPRVLGAGSFGVAYEVSYKGKRAALKLTEDPSEARAANHLKGKRLRHIIPFFDVFSFPGTSVYGVLQGLAEPLGDEEAEEFDAVTVALRKAGPHGVGEALVKGDFEGVYLAVERKFGPDAAEAFMESAVHFDLRGMIEELRANGITFYDYHAGNVMVYEGRYVLIDLGMSRSPGARPDVLERVDEASRGGDQVAVTIGRYQPFHRGHADAIRDMARRHTRVVVLVAGNKRDARNPFSYDLRVRMMRESLPDVSDRLEVYKAEADGRPSSYVPGILSAVIRDHSAAVEMGTAVELVVGPDRVADLKKQLEHARQAKEAGEEHEFDPDLAVVREAPGAGDDDAGRVSGTRVRKALADNDVESLRGMLDPHLQTDPAEFDGLVAELRRQLAEVTPVREARRLAEIGVDLDTVGEGGVVRALTFVAPLLAKKGVEVPSLRRLGNGQMGIAYLVSPGKVLKVTTDAKEARTCNHLLHVGNLPHAGKVFDVFKFPQVPNVAAQLYGVIQEELTPLSPQERREFDGLVLLMHEEPVSEVLKTSPWAAVLSAVRTLIERDVEQEMFPSGVPKDISTQRRARLQQAVHAKTTEFETWAKKYNVGVIVDELHGAGISFVDYHSGNMMKRGSTYVINDLGMSRSPGAEPPVIERVVEGRKKDDPEDEAEDLGFGFNADGYPIQDRYEFAGFTVCVENKRGSKRQWGERPSQHTVMRNDYGYLPDWDGADGDEVDVYIGPDEKAEWVYVVHQMKAPKFKAFDEDKVMMGFSSADKAKRAYLAHYDREGFFGGMSVMSLDDFRKKLRKHEGKKLTNEAGVLDRLVRELTEDLGALGTSNWSRPPVSHDPEEDALHDRPDQVG